MAYYRDKRFFLRVARQVEKFVSVGLFLLDPHDLTSWVFDDEKKKLMFMKPHLIFHSEKLWLKN